MLGGAHTSRPDEPSVVVEAEAWGHHDGVGFLVPSSFCLLTCFFKNDLLGLSILLLGAVFLGMM